MATANCSSDFSRMSHDDEVATMQVKLRVAKDCDARHVFSIKGGDCRKTFSSDPCLKLTYFFCNFYLRESDIT